jgi:hypothetical protein
MLFSAWHAVTHALHPSQRSKSTAIPHLGIRILDHSSILDFKIFDFRFVVEF